MATNTFEGAILVVDDDAGLRETIADFLTLEGYTIRMAGGVAEARALIASAPPDLILLDINMPGGSGLTLAGELRQTSAIPIIILSGKGSMVDRVVGLEVGADDYLGKPFELRELLARIRAVMRRTRGNDVREPDNRAERQGRFDVFVLTPSRRELATIDGARIELTPSEFNLVAAFADRPNRILSRDTVADLTRKDDWNGFDRSVDTTISRLRRKFAPYTDAAQLFQTVRGEGYVLACAVKWTGPRER